MSANPAPERMGFVIGAVKNGTPGGLELSTLWIAART